MAWGQSSAPPSRVFTEGEDLVYNVRYGFIDLGQVRIKTLKRVRTGSTTAYETRATIDSYSSIPFVSLHAVFESMVDSSVYSREFVGKIRDGDTWDFGRYHYDPSHSRALLEVGRNDTVVTKRETLAVSSPYQDGLSLFFFAREHLLAGRGMTIPTIIKEEKVTTRIGFWNKRTSVEVDAIDHPVDVVEFAGTADFVGIFGMTGDFEGWFSNDEARVPILATMKVILGSVTIELMRWSRPGWVPPKAQ
jgi:hypothetical protein